MPQTPDSWDRIQALFEQALDLPPEHREAFLREACPNHPQAVFEVQSRLDNYPAAEPERGVSPLHLHANQRGSLPQLPAGMIPGYEIQQELHRGGQGVVYLALQQGTKRQVALKLMLEGPLASDAARRRFEREVELVGSLRHPGIVPIFASGCEEGQYYLSMEYIHGQHLDRYVQAGELSQTEILVLFEKICAAVDYAHQKGVIHRDLKPSNVLVDTSGEPHVLDFGLAKLGGEPVGADPDKLLLTQTGQVMGTLAYMSPEQAAGRPDQVNMRSDVYALGVILYQLFTQQLPYQLASSMADNLNTIQASEPRRLMFRGGRVNAEVETIILKALAKEPERRYSTAGDLRQDIARFLRGDSIEAKRDSLLYVIRKTLRKNLLPTVVASSFLLMIVFSSILVWSLYLTADSASRLYRAERDKAESHRDQLHESLYFAEMNLAGQAANEPGGVVRVKELIARWTPNRGRDSHLPLADPSRRVAVQQLHGWEWYYLHSLSDRELHKFTQKGACWCVAGDRDGGWVATGNALGEVYLFRVATGQPYRLGKHSRAVRDVAFSPDGKKLASGGADGDVRVWDTQTHQLLETFHYGNRVMAVGWHPTQPIVAATGHGGGVILWDVESGRQLREFRQGNPYHSAAEQPRDDGELVAYALHWSPDGSRLAAGYYDASLRVWQLNTGDELACYTDHQFGIFAVRWHPEGRLLGSCDRGGNIIVRDTSDGTQAWSATEDCRLWTMAWSPNGGKLATAGRDGTIRIRQGQDGRPHHSIHGHTDDVWSIAWSADGGSILSSAYDGTVRVWDAGSTKQNRIIQAENDARFVSWHPSGTQLAAPYGRSSVRSWVATQAQEHKTFADLRSTAMFAEWSPDGTRVVIAEWDKRVTVWDAQTGKLLVPFHGHQQSPTDGATKVRLPAPYINPIHEARWSPDGRWIASCSHVGEVLVWDAATGDIVASTKERTILRCLDWHPSGKWLAYSNRRHEIKRWNPHTGESSKPLRGHTQTVRCIRWSPDGKLLGSTSPDSTARIWDCESSELLSTLKEHVGDVTSVSWHPSGRRLATVGADKTVRIWDPHRARQTLAIKGHTGVIWAVAWNPDGTQLASIADDGQLRIWDASEGYRRANVRP